MTAGESETEPLRLSIEEARIVALAAQCLLHPPAGDTTLDDLHAMIDLALFLKRNGYRPDQVQDFIPAPFDIATCMYYTGIDPITKKPVQSAKNLRDRKLQRALMQFFKPENYFAVREALTKAGRADLIGDGCDSLIPATPPKGALDARRKDANKTLKADYYHSVPAAGKGYRPGRRSQSRRDRTGGT